MVATSTTSVHASVCQLRPVGHHYYALINSGPITTADHGAQINIDTTTVTTGSPTSQFVDHEMWYSVDAHCQYWVEVGVTDGVKSAGGSADKDVFWADNRANGAGYHEHYPAVAWNLATYYTAKVVWAGNNSWHVYWAGKLIGTSTANYYGGATRCLTAGIEATSAAATEHVAGHMTKWYRKDNNDVWYAGWGGAKLLSYCPSDIDVSNGVTTETLHGPN